MSFYIKYDLGNNVELWIEADAPTSGVAPAGVGDLIADAKCKFEDALDGIKQSAMTIREKLSDLRADEVEVSFGIKATGELGNFAIGKVGAEANYEVKLKWTNE